MCYGIAALKSTTSSAFLPLTTHLVIHVTTKIHITQFHSLRRLANDVHRFTYHRTLNPDVVPADSPINCAFDEGSGLCGWMPDPRDSAAKWHAENGTACLRPQATVDPFFAEIGLGASSGHPSARLWSPSVVAGADLKCLTFVYRFSSWDKNTVGELRLQSHSSGWGRWNEGA